jgi:hypothetical protein
VQKNEKNSFGLLVLEMADLERFLRKIPLVLYGLNPTFSLGVPIGR